MCHLFYVLQCSSIKKCTIPCCLQVHLDLLHLGTSGFHHHCVPIPWFPPVMLTVAGTGTVSEVSSVSLFFRNWSRFCYQSSLCTICQGGCSLLITWFCTHSKKLMSGFLSEMCWRLLLVLYLHVRQSQKCRVNCNVLGLGHFHQRMQHGLAENRQGSCGNCSASCVCRELSAVLSASSSVRYYRVKSTQ